MGVRVSFTGIQAGLCGSTRVRAGHHSSRKIAFLHVKGHKAPGRGTWVLEIYLGAVAHGAMWGYGVDPPSDTHHFAVTCGFAGYAQRGNQQTRRLEPWGFNSLSESPD